MDMVINLVSAVIAFLKTLFGIANKSPLAIANKEHSDYHSMSGRSDAPVSIASSTAEMIPSASAKQSNTMSCGIAEVCEEQKTLAVTIPASRISKPARTQNQAAAQAFVREILRAGPVPVATAVQSAEEAGFTRHQVRRACEKLKIVRTKLPGMCTGWIWTLPGVNASPDTGSPIHTCGCSDSGVA